MWKIVHGFFSVCPEEPHVTSVQISLVNASDIAVADFPKGREAHTYGVDKDWDSNPDGSTLPCTVRKKRRRRPRGGKRKPRKNIKKPLCQGVRRLKFSEDV